MAVFTSASDESCVESGCMDPADGVKWSKSGLAKQPGEVNQEIPDYRGDLTWQTRNRQLCRIRSAPKCKELRLR